MTHKIIKYLLKKEWSSGNGQCPVCSGVPESWIGHPCYPTNKTVGHKKGCILALMLEKEGVKPLYIGKSKSKYMRPSEPFMGTIIKDTRMFIDKVIVDYFESMKAEVLK